MQEPEKRLKLLRYPYDKLLDSIRKNSKMKNKIIATDENKCVLNTLSKYIDLTVTPYGLPVKKATKIDKRDPMYGGNGIVYLLHMFEKDELVNNRIGVYMALLNKGDEAGFHEHGSKKEQEIYVVMNGAGEYVERTGKDGDVRKNKITKGSITSIRKDGFHSVKNIGDEPLIIFVVTTYEPEN